MEIYFYFKFHMAHGTFYYSNATHARRNFLDALNRFGFLRNIMMTHTHAQIVHCSICQVVGISNFRYDLNRFHYMFVYIANKEC